MALLPVPADERRHPSGAVPDWEESWDFDFVAGDGELAGFVRLALRPNERRAWYWAYLAGPDRDLVVVRDHDVDLPRGPALEVRGTGLWAQLTCETPLDHWSMGLEASGVALDDPTESWRAELGLPIPLGLDLEWEATAKAAPLDDESNEGGYGQPSRVSGDVLLGPARFEIDGTGWRSHSWGSPPWQDGYWRATASFDDGTALCATSGGRAWTWAPGKADLTAREGEAQMAVERTAAGLPVSAALTHEGFEVTVTPVSHAPVPLGGARLVRSQCEFTGSGLGGRGWCEWVSGGA